MVGESLAGYHFIAKDFGCEFEWQVVRQDGLFFCAKNGFPYCCAMELTEYITWAKTQQPFSKLGFFSQPVLATHGPLANKMLKVYPPFKKEQEALTLQDNHHQYIQLLRDTGRHLPETIMEIVKTGNCYTPLVIQRSFEKQELLRGIMESCTSHNAYLSFLRLILEDTLNYLSYLAKQNSSTLGFHPTLRNYAFHNQTLYYFDTFPPMNMGQAELNQWVRATLPQKSLRALSRVFPVILNKVTHEYYDSTAMVTGIIGSACRLKPEWADVSLKWAKNYLMNHENSALPIEPILEKLQTNPRLSLGWTTIRKLTKNIGKPNV